MCRRDRHVRPQPRQRKARTSRRATKTTRRTRRTPRTASSVAAPAAKDFHLAHGALPGRRSPQVRQLPAQKHLPTNSGLEAAGSRVRPEASGDRAKGFRQGRLRAPCERGLRALSYSRARALDQGEGGGKVLNPAWKLWERRRRKGRRVDGFGDLISAPVRLKELSGNVTLNGRTGSMRTFDPTENMYVVELDEPAELDGIDRVKVPPEHLDPLNATAQRRMAYNATNPCARSVRALNPSRGRLRACARPPARSLWPQHVRGHCRRLICTSSRLSGPRARVAKRTKPRSTSLRN